MKEYPGVESTGAPCETGQSQCTNDPDIVIGESHCLGEPPFIPISDPRAALEGRHGWPPSAHVYSVPPALYERYCRAWKEYADVDRLVRSNPRYLLSVVRRFTRGDDVIDEQVLSRSDRP